MPVSRNHPAIKSSHDLGVLLVGGDWACAHGDAGGLADVATRLGHCTRGKVRDDARRVARLCRTDHEQAVRYWVDLHARLHRQLIAAADRCSA